MTQTKICKPKKTLDKKIENLLIAPNKGIQRRQKAQRKRNKNNSLFLFKAQPVHKVYHGHCEISYIYTITHSKYMQNQTPRYHSQRSYLNLYTFPS